MLDKIFKELKSSYISIIEIISFIIIFLTVVISGFGIIMTNISNGFC